MKKIIYKKLKKLILNTTFKNLSYISIGTFGAAFFALLFGIVAARYLGPDEFGRFGYYKSIFTTVGIFFVLGMNTYVVINIAKYPKKTNKSITCNFINRTLAIIFTSTVFWLINYVMHFIPVENATILLFFASIVTNYSSLFSGVIRAYEEMKYLGFFKILQPILTLGLFILTAAIFKMRIEGAAFASLISVSIVAILSYNIIIRKIKYKYVKVYFYDITNLFVNSLPFLLTSIVSILYLQVDTIMINRMVNDSETGFYLIASQIIKSILLIAGIFNTILLPKMSKFNFNSSDNKIWLKLLLILGLIVSIILFFSSDYLIQILFGSKYSYSSNILKILSFIIPISFISASLSAFFSAKNQQKKVLFINTLILILNIPFNYLLIIRWQAAGAAISTLLCSIITIILFIIFYRLYIKKYEKNKSKKCDVI